MSKLICASAIDGALEWVLRAEAMLDQAMAGKGESCKVAFPATAYYLPVIYSFTGEKVETLADCRRILARAKAAAAASVPATRCGCPTSATRSTPASRPCSPARSSRPAST